MAKKTKAEDKTQELMAARKKRIVVWTGIIAGLVFSATLWIPDAYALQSAHAVHPWAKLIMGILPVTALCTLVAWLADRSGKNGLKILMWIAAGAAIAFFAGHLPFEGLSLYYRVFDPAIAARVSYPFNAAISYRVLSLTLISAIIIGISGIFFGRMIDNATSATRRGGAFVTMLVWSIFFFGSAWTINQTLQAPFLRPVEIINQLIEFKIADEQTPLSAAEAQSINLAAIEPAAGVIHAPRSLVLARYDALVNETGVQIDFGGQWVDCSVVVDRSSGKAVLMPGVCKLEQ